MLTEICCDKFICDGAERGPIHLNPGLNAVMGDGSTKSNSIGKSTFLMVIDFCFGGVDYVLKEEDTMRHVGDHLIKFKFEFGGIPYYYSRSTSRADYKFVNECDENYQTIRTISLGDFNHDLKAKYGMGGVDLTFRAAIGRFFRIYNRNTHNELRPLNTVARESDSSGITDMLKLYGLYQGMYDYEEAYQTALDKKSTFGNMKRFSSAPIATSEAEVNRNEKEIAELTEELARIRKDNDLGMTDEENLRAAAKNELGREKSRLQREKRKLKAQKSDIEFDQEIEPVKMTRKYDALLEFFPNANVEKIQELDTFHKRVRAIVKDEAEKSNQEIDSFIEVLDARIEEINLKLANYKDAPNVKDEIIDRTNEINQRIRELQISNENYRKNEAAKDEFKTAQSERKDAIISKTSTLEHMVNSSMEQLNSMFDHGQKYAPRLKISEFDSYQFFTPNDTGTGSRNKGLWLFDLTVLHQTTLPAFVHDSILFNSTEYERTKVALDLYAAESEKQIFVAIDDPNAGNGIFRDVVTNHAVLVLGHNSHALFGEEWNTKGDNQQ